MDSHNCDRLVVNGMVKNEGNVEEGGFGPYPISYRAITPKENEVSNLIVPVCLSATHIAYGSIRMEPVFMVLGQSSALAAVQAIDRKLSVQKIDVARLQQQLKKNPLADGSTPDILIDNNDSDKVQLRGNWTKKSHGGFGPDYFEASEDADTAKFVRYMPGSKTNGKYDLYTYYPKLDAADTETSVTIFDGKKSNTTLIKGSEVKVIGQTSGEWVHLGRYTFTGQGQPYIEIRAKGKKVVADAVLLVAASRE